MTMWGGRFREGPSALLRALNDSFAFDRELFAEDVQGSIAWAQELARAGVLSPEEERALVEALRSCGAVAAPATGGQASANDTAPEAGAAPPFRSCGAVAAPATGGQASANDTAPEAGAAPPVRSCGAVAASATGGQASASTTAPEAGAAPRVDGYEDVHSYVEDSLRARVGALAGKLHTGRSRNDQVATDLKLWLKKACDDFDALTRALARTLASKAVDHAATPMPGYTHLKQAEPVTFGHWCLAYVEMLRRDISRMQDARARGDECPLGSGALAGTPLPIDRERLAQSLGFARATANSLDAVSDRDFAAEYLFAASLTLTHLSRMAEDLIFFTSDEAAYAELPDSMATGSSRMPQKKNPDVLELTRGYAARSIGELTGFLALLKGLPLAYNKDLQLDKEPLFRTRALLAVLLPALTALVAGLKINARMSEAAAGPLLLSTDAADELAAQGIPFREAHEIVSRGGMHSSNDVQTVLAKKNVLGGTAPARVEAAAKAALEKLE